MVPGAIILCGGESRRMGRPKAWLPFGDELMLARIVRLVSVAASPVVVVAAPDQPLPPLHGSVLVAHDPVSGRGPLQGLAAGMRALPGDVELCYATSTDVPFLEPAWIRTLLWLIGDADLAIPFVEGRHHPLAALYRPATVLPEIDRLLEADRRRPVYLMERLRTREVDAAELRPADPALATLRNLNTPEDYVLALADAGLEPEVGASMGPHPTSVIPRIRFELFGVPRLRAGAIQVCVPAATVREALLGLAQQCPGLLGTVLSSEGGLLPSYTLNLDGRRFVTDPDTTLADGDALLLLALDAGG